MDRLVVVGVVVVGTVALAVGCSFDSSVGKNAGVDTDERSASDTATSPLDTGGGAVTAGDGDARDSGGESDAGTSTGAADVVDSGDERDGSGGDAPDVDGGPEGDGGEDAETDGCTPEPERCGDGVDNDCDGEVDAEDSDCLPGGTCQNDRQCLGTCASSNECAYRIFITPQGSTGDLSGLSGADQHCTRAASDANLEGSWIAVASVQGAPARGRFSVTAPLYNMNGELVATDGGDLWDGAIENPVAYDVNGSQVADDVEVWTGTTVGGAADPDCEGWSSESGFEGGQEGNPHETGEAWIEDPDPIGPGENERCSEELRLYCVETL